MMMMIKTSVLSLLCASSVGAFAPHQSGSAFVGGTSKIASVRSQGMWLFMVIYQCIWLDGYG
jgi:hypothetical protein